MSEPSVPGTVKFEAIWIFRDEIKHAGLMAELDAHASQPLGRPLHKHQGYIQVDQESVTFIETDNWKQVRKSDITEMEVGYDDNFRRFRDSRGLLPPMHLSFYDDKVYIFTKKSRLEGWEGQNSALFEAIAIR